LARNETAEICITIHQIGRLLYHVLKFDEQKEEQIEITKRHAYQMVGNLSLYIFGCFFKEQDR
jgi:hypothetical protein